eukprot:CCRYP_020497-RF/>CCRYP_020497-RF protein AED:0.46 eAED:1.00 QI:0/-1/0/1/-1/0/1/0/16
MQITGQSTTHPPVIVI